MEVAQKWLEHTRKAFKKKAQEEGQEEGQEETRSSHEPVLVAPGDVAISKTSGDVPTDEVHGLMQSLDGRMQGMTQNFEGKMAEMQGMIEKLLDAQQPSRQVLEVLSTASRPVSTDGGTRTIPSGPVSKAVSFSRSPAPKPDQTGAAGVLPRAARPAARAVAPKPSAPATEPPLSSAPAPAPTGGLFPPLSISRNPIKGLTDAVKGVAAFQSLMGEKSSAEEEASPAVEEPPSPKYDPYGFEIPKKPKATEAAAAGAAQAEDDPTPVAPKYDVYGFELKTGADAPKPAEADIETAGPPKYDVYGFPLKGHGSRI